jgi:hypothetical protein
LLSATLNILYIVEPNWSVRAVALPGGEGANPAAPQAAES